MSDSEIRALVEKYDNARKSRLDARRRKYFQEEISQEGKEFLGRYLFETDIPIRELCEDAGISISDGLRLIRKTAFGLLFQNPAIARRLLE